MGYGKKKAPEEPVNAPSLQTAQGATWGKGAKKRYDKQTEAERRAEIARANREKKAQNVESAASVHIHEYSSKKIKEAEQIRAGSSKSGGVKRYVLGTILLVAATLNDHLDEGWEDGSIIDSLGNSAEFTGDALAAVFGFAADAAGMLFAAENVKSFEGEVVYNPNKNALELNA